MPRYQTPPSYAQGGVTMGAAYTPTPATGVLRTLKWLLWTYFWLLMLEGALRKWFLPGLATPLLIVRDPVLLVMYGMAASVGLFPRGAFMTALLGVAFLFVPLGLLQLANGSITWPVLLYGLRTNFLHLPLIFLIPKILNYQDLRRLGLWILLMAPMMAILMGMQFRAPSGARINAAIGDGQQLETSLGKIRPAGTFSFITGAVDFWAMASAFILLGVSVKRTYPVWLSVVSGGSLVLAIAVSGSRSAFLTTTIVFCLFFIGLAFTKRLGSGLVKFGIIGLALLILAAKSNLVREGINVLTVRFTEAGVSEGNAKGLAIRFFGALIGPIQLLLDTPFFGFGIGRGTNVGSALLTGKLEFLVAEGEWGRVIGEAGPIAGLALVVYRCVLAAWLGLRSYRAAKLGSPLALHLFGACALNVMSGQWGPPTSLGFAVLVAGLCLAAAESPFLVTQNSPPPVTPIRQAPIRRIVASRMKVGDAAIEVPTRPNDSPR